MKKTLWLPSASSLQKISLVALLILIHVSALSSKGQSQATQTAPADLLSSIELPEDLIKSIVEDSEAASCWTDQLDGKNLDWNKDPATPIVKYQYRFRNTCQKSIACTLVIASGTKLKDPGTAKRSWRPYRADRRSFTIKPGETVSISGSLPWTSTDLRMPSLRDSDMPCWFN